MPDQTNDFVVSRDFDASRETLWACLTEPERMRQWWGPKCCKVVAANMDLRPGGSYHYGLQMPNGDVMWGKFGAFPSNIEMLQLGMRRRLTHAPLYREIVAPERLEFINFFSDETGGITRHPLVPTWPLQMLSTFSLDETGGKTRFTVRWRPQDASEEERSTFNSPEMRVGMTNGWSGTMDQLESYLAASR